MARVDKNLVKFLLCGRNFVDMVTYVHAAAKFRLAEILLGLVAAQTLFLQNFVGKADLELIGCFKCNPFESLAVSKTNCSISLFIN